MSAGSTSATRPSGSGGTALARCSPPRSERGEWRTGAAILSGDWHLDEAFVKVNGKLCYLWRAVEGEVLEAVVTAKRDKAAALRFLRRLMKRHGRAQTVVTDRLSYYPAAMKEIGAADRQEVGRRLNNRAENSHQPFRRHCQSKFYTACSRTRARRSSTVFAHELPPRSAGFDVENRLYLFALTVPA